MGLEEDVIKNKSKCSVSLNSAWTEPIFVEERLQVPARLCHSCPV